MMFKKIHHETVCDKKCDEIRQYFDLLLENIRAVQNNSEMAYETVCDK